MPDVQLSDDIEQMLVDGQQLRATHELMKRRGLSRNDARILVGRWFYERRQARTGLAGIDANAADGDGLVRSDQNTIRPEPQRGSTEIDALHRLVDIARGNTGQSRKVANFLLAWWNAGSCGGWDLTELWEVDRVIADDMLAVAAIIARHHEYPTAYGLQAEFEALVAQWRPHLLRSAPSHDLDQPE